jgi:hypothetical protein
MNSLLAALWRLRFSPLPYLLIAVLVALGAFQLLVGEPGSRAAWFRPPRRAAGNGH